MVTHRSLLTIAEQISKIEDIYNSLKTAKDLDAKLKIVESVPETSQFLESSPLLKRLLLQSDNKNSFVVKGLLAIGQGPIIFQDLDRIEDLNEAWNKFLGLLSDMENFYDMIGGVVGYHLTMLKLIDACQHKTLLESHEGVSFQEPEGLKIFQDTPEARKAVRWGIDHLREMAEIYPVGGAGDRLNLQDEKTGELLPAAQLQFCGRTLLEGLIRDLQGREFLYYKLFGRQLVTPIALMTSYEKNNHQRVSRICESLEWFGRSKKSFHFFIQPLVPMLTIEGDWAMQAPLKPILKPGGHGVIWKLAEDQGIFKWFESLQRHKAIVRQINNPVAGIDNGLLALAGLGCHKKKDFGFASCYRLLNTAEGMDVLREKQVSGGYEYCITNVEYTEFEKFGIADAPVQQGSPYSHFPSNTNILFADLKAIREAVKVCPIPGKLINMKTKVSCYQSSGMVEKQAGRLESIMQNIADHIVDHCPKRLGPGEHNDLRTFLTFNKRSKTLSVAKQAYESGKSIVGTPEGCFYELMENYRDLLVNYCRMDVPPLNDEKEYMDEGSSFVVLFHPALGGVYSVISQKIHGGKLAKWAEWVMEVAEAEVVNLNLEGSLLIEADNIMGKKNSEGLLTFDNSQTGKCTLINVTVKNKGIDRSFKQASWKRQVHRSESLRITLHGNAEFFAENVILEGDMYFDVPSDHRLVIYQQGEEIAWHYDPIDGSSWEWEYILDNQDRILLEKIKKV